MTIKKVSVLGSGVLGSQIAFQTAFKGFTVSVYDINDTALTAAKTRVEKLQPQYIKDLKVTAAETAAAAGRMSFFTDLKAAVTDADLVIEAVPEVPDIKTALYKQLAPLLPAKTILATNSSTFLPSYFAAVTGRPEKYLSLHFANHIWLYNTAEIMRHPKTDGEVFKAVIAFAAQIGMVPIVLNKEQPGYVLNSLLVPFLNAGLMLWAKDIATPADIDKTWMIAAGAPTGPFAVIDTIGIRTVYNLTAAAGEKNPTLALAAAKLKSEFLDQGKLGEESGQGFYQHPHPTYKNPDFLKP